MFFGLPAEVLEILCLFGSFTCSAGAIALLVKIIWYWKDPDVSKMWPAIALVVLIVMRAVLYYVWATQMLLPNFARLDANQTDAKKI